MRLFRAKELIGTNGGFIRKGALFLVENPFSDLPSPVGGDLQQNIKDSYEELVSPNMMFPLSKLIKIKEIK